MPRNFTLTKDGHHIVIANQNSSKLVVVGVNGKGGMEVVSEVQTAEPPTFVYAL